MNAIVLAIPIIFIRYGVVSFLSQKTKERTDFFPPTQGIEDQAKIIYQLSIIFLLGYLFFSTININNYINYSGILFISLGSLFYLKSIIDFSKIDEQGIASQGIYRFSRNPMYIGFFIYFLGCSLLIESILYFAVLIVFQIAVHFIILSEERWCLNKLGEHYKEYMRRVRRYI